MSSAAGDLSADVPVSGLPAGTTSVDLTLQTVDAGRADVAGAIDAAGIASADAVVVEFLVSDQNGNAITDFGGQTLSISITLDPADKAVFKLVGSTLTQIPEAQLSRGADGTITVSLTDDIVLVVGPPPAPEEEVAPVEEEPAVPGVIPLAFRGAPARGFPRLDGGRHHRGGGPQRVRGAHPDHLVVGRERLDPVRAERAAAVPDRLRADLRVSAIRRRPVRPPREANAGGGGPWAASVSIRRRIR